MAKGGFDRRVKVEDGRVVDHRPVDHKDALGWHVVHVPKDIPATLNELITAGALCVKDEKLTWDEDWREKFDQREIAPSEKEVVLEALKIKLSEEELQAARNRLIQAKLETGTFNRKDFSK